MKQFAAVVLAIGLAACQTVAPDEPATAAQAQGAEIAAGSEPTETLAFAQAACGGCHAVEPDWQSPNPEAPTFESIANRKGLTQATLSTYLRDAHNYPEAMDFDLTGSRVEQLSAYVLSLRNDDYRRVP